MTDQAAPASWIHYKGHEYAWPPPPGWWQASDGRWYPPTSLVDSRRLWEKKRFYVPVGLVTFLVLALLLPPIVDGMLNALS